MNSKNKIIIIALTIIIISLIIGIATISINNDYFNVQEASDGNIIYNFDSVFTMEVPENTKFIKEWLNETENGILIEGDEKIYFSKNGEFSVAYIYSRMLNNERVDYILDEGNGTVEEYGDFSIIHNLNATGKVGKNYDDADFKELIYIYKGDNLVVIEGNDLDLIKSMANTIKFRAD